MRKCACVKKTNVNTADIVVNVSIMAAHEKNDLVEEKNLIINKYIKLKKEYQSLFFKYKEKCSENDRIKGELTSFQVENARLNKQLADHGENKNIETKCIMSEKNIDSTQIISTEIKPQIDSLSVKQESIESTNNSMMVNITDRKRVCKPQRKPKTPIVEYEIEKIVDHRVRAKKREFLVQWKNYSAKHNSWSKEADLNCTQLLAEYF